MCDVAWCGVKLGVVWMCVCVFISGVMWCGLRLGVWRLCGVM